MGECHVRRVKAAVLAGLLAALMLMLCGCGMMLVEDSQPVKIGSGLKYVLFT